MKKLLLILLLGFTMVNCWDWGKEVNPKDSKELSIIEKNKKNSINLIVSEALDKLPKGAELKNVDLNEITKGDKLMSDEMLENVSTKQILYFSGILLIDINQTEKPFDKGDQVKIDVIASYSTDNMGLITELKDLKDSKIQVKKQGKGEWINFN